nr:hypothetical protein [Tanacetum cinerariifolium]
IKLVSKHQNTQQFGALLSIELINAEIRNSKAYKDYYVIATGEAAPKPKVSVRRTRSSSDTSITPPTAAASPRPTTSAKDKQTAKASKAKSADEGTGSKLGVPDVPTDKSKEELSWNSTDDEGDNNKEKDDDSDKEDEGDDGQEGNGDDDDEDDDGEEGDDDDIDQDVVRDDDKDDDEEGGDDESNEETRDEESFDPIPQTLEDSEDEGDREEDLGLNIGMESIFKTTSQLDVQTPTYVAPLPMTAPTMTPSTIATITTTSQAPILPTTVPSNIIQNLPNFGLLFRFDDRLRSLETNFSEAIQTNQFAGAVSAIPGIVQRLMDQRMNEAVKVAVQIQSYHLREEAQRENDEFLKTIDENIKNIITEQVKEQVKRRRDDDADKDEEPSARPDRGSKRRREGKEPKLASAPTKTATRSVGANDQPIVQSSQHPEWFSHQQKPPSSDGAWNKTMPSVHGSIQPWISKLAKQADTRSSFNELTDTPLDISNFLINRLKVDTLTPELLAGPTYELMKGSCKSLIELEYHLEEVFKANWNGSTPKVNKSARDAYSKRSIIAVTELKIVEWHSYKHLDWITVRRDNDKLYKFKECDFKRLHIQDIEDMLLLLVQGKLTNLTVEERFAFNVSLRMFIRSIVIQRRVEDLQLGVKSYQKKLNLTKPDSYRSDLKRKKAYIAYSNLRGFIYQNKDKRNRLMRIDELHKFSDGTAVIGYDCS